MREHPELDGETPFHVREHFGHVDHHLGPVAHPGDDRGLTAAVALTVEPLGQRYQHALAQPRPARELQSPAETAPFVLGLHPQVHGIDGEPVADEDRLIRLVQR